MKGKDYYRVLDVDHGATVQVIKESYRRLAFQYHPDRNRTDPDCVEKMKEINEAYAVLSDVEKRRQYDRMEQEYGPSAYDHFRQSYSDQDIFRGSDINQIFEEMARGFGFRGFEEIFRESYGRGYRSFEFRRPGVFGRVIVFGGGARGQGNTLPPLQDMLPGGLIGKIGRYVLKRMIGQALPDQRDIHDAIVLEPQQARDGGTVTYFDRTRQKEVSVAVPAGMEEGRVIRLRGMGLSGPLGMEAGDLYLRVEIRRSLLQKARAFLKV